MSVRRTYHHRIGLAGKVDVVGVATLTGDEAPVLLAADRLPDARSSRTGLSDMWTLRTHDCTHASHTRFGLLLNSRE
jgi:hypothetical protein